MKSNLSKNTILFVDDEHNILSTLKRVFRKEGYTLLFAVSGMEGLTLFQEHYPGIVVSDQQMPGMKGYEFLNSIRELAPETIRILLTGYSDINATISAINEGGIYRYITKPWNDDDIRLIIRQAVDYLNMAEENRRLTDLTKEQNEKLRSLNLSLEKKVFERTREISEKNTKLKELLKELENNFFSFIRAYVGVLELYNPFFGNHSKRVSTFSRLMARKLKLPEDSIQNIEVAALLHDIGMIGIPKYILDTPLGDLKEEEREIFIQHPVMGEATLSSMKKLSKVSSIIRFHHENFDGSGFPDHISKDNIPIESRIISVADAFDEVKKLGIYKQDPAHENPVSFIKDNSGRRFDPVIVDLFFKVLEELKLRASGEKMAAVYELKEGMVISRDVVSSTGLFLIAKDTLLNNAYMERIKAYNKLSHLDGRIYVYDK